MKESENIRFHVTDIPEKQQVLICSINAETGELRSRTLVAIVREEDIRCEQIINRLNKGEITLSEAVTIAKAELDKEYSEPLDNLIWNLAMEEHRMPERKDKKR